MIRERGAFGNEVLQPFVVTISGIYVGVRNGGDADLLSVLYV